MPDPAAFNHRVPFVIRFSDLDAMGHLNNVEALRILEASRIDYFVDVGLAAHNELRFVLAGLNCDFHAQAFYRDNGHCGTRTLRVGRSSILLDQRLCRDDDVVLLEARSTIVALGPDQRSPLPVPDHWLAALTAREGRPIRREHS